MKKPFILFFLLVCLQASYAQLQWPAITQTSKPWTRWWWMGSAVDAKNIKLSMQQYANAGFGGVEITPIYGAKSYEQSYIPFLSNKWMQMLDTTVFAAKHRNMGVIVSVGTGWPIGGPQVNIQDAATKLVIQNYTLQEGQSLNEKIIINDVKQRELQGVGLTALIAYGNNGLIKDITNKVSSDGTLNWVAEKGNWNLYAAFIGKTLQKVKRAAPGGQGYTLDHFAANSLSNYFKRFDSAYGKTAHGVTAFYNDSYEVFNADWTPDFFNEFKARRGYDLKYYLRELYSNNTNDTVARIKSDYRETIADLMLGNFSAKFSKWAHSKGSKVINQAHGSPANLLDMYAAVDIAETETFGSSYFPIKDLRRDTSGKEKDVPDPFMLKFASSAAHAVGHNLSSAETFTWLTEHFKTSWSQCKPEVEQLFLSGINHVFYHGTTYSPNEVAWPGWLFYASVNFVPNNSLWPHLYGLNNYVSRCQSILQAGKPDNEVAVYWPVYDAWNNNSKGKDMPLKIHNVEDWLQGTSFYKSIEQLSGNGYSLDYVSDKMLLQATVKNNQFSINDSAAAYKVLVVPQCNTMPLSTLQKLKQLAENGASIVFEQLPTTVNGFNDLLKRTIEFNQFITSFNFTKLSNGIQEMKIGKGRILLSAHVKQALQYINIEGEALTATGLKFIRRNVVDGKYYYIVNHTASTIDTTIALQANAKTVVVLDPQTGKQGLATASNSKGKTFVHLQLQSGESWILKTTNKAIKTTAWHYAKVIQQPITLTNPWQVAFVKGGPTLPTKRTITSLSSWTIWNDTALQNFSGTAVYTTTFNINKTANDYILQLGKVCESAKVWVNGKEVGLAWSIPFQLNIGSYLKNGNNELKIEVANLMANRISYMDRNNMQWRNYHEINFVNINYKPFDASGWEPMLSGLLGPVTIQAVQFTK